MKLSRAAALALVGWYLMLPPMNEKGVFSDAPMSDWDQIESFENAAACEQALRLSQDALSATSDQEFKERSQQEAAQNGKMIISKVDALRRANNGKCIASDDPRLKGN